MHTHTHRPRPTPTRSHTHTPKPTHTHTHTQTHTYTNSHTHRHTHTHTQTCTHTHAPNAYQLSSSSSSRDWLLSEVHCRHHMSALIPGHKSPQSLPKIRPRRGPSPPPPQRSATTKRHGESNACTPHNSSSQPQRDGPPHRLPNYSHDFPDCLTQPEPMCVSNCVCVYMRSVCVCGHGKERGRFSR